MDAKQGSVADLPNDDPSRVLTAIASADSTGMVHVGIVGDTYTILLSGAQTADKFCLIDMHVPPGGGPAPHRHDFEETFTLLEGELELTFRGEKTTLRAGGTANIPANAPHSFHNVAATPARMLCVCAPAGNEQFFLELGTRVPTRTSPPPPMSPEEVEAFKQKAVALAPRFRTELLPQG